MSDINLHVVLVQAWVKKDNQYLMAQRSLQDDQAAGMWSIPGGKVDLDMGNGIIENTLKREILEEVGIEIKTEIKYIGSQAFIRSSGHHVVSLTFIAEWESGEARPLEDQETVRWMNISEIEDIIHKKEGPKHFEQYLQILKNK
jgi:ADP-ribose pyrophosphatase YjhB (NUDIX family)